MKRLMEMVAEAEEKGSSYKKGRFHAEWAEAQGRSRGRDDEDEDWGSLEVEIEGVVSGGEDADLAKAKASLVKDVNLLLDKIGKAVERKSRYKGKGLGLRLYSGKPGTGDVSVNDDGTLVVPVRMSLGNEAMFPGGMVDIAAEVAEQDGWTWTDDHLDY